MRSDALLRVAGLFDRALFVGDPGQLDPFSTVETERWLGLTWDPMSSAVAVLLTNNPDIPVHALPVSWRLPASAAPVVSEAFYPFTGFAAATEAERAADGVEHAPVRTELPLILPWRRPPRPAGRCTSWPPAHPAAPTPRRSPPAPRWPPGCCSAARSTIRSGPRRAPRSPRTGSRSA